MDHKVKGPSPGASGRSAFGTIHSLHSIVRVTEGDGPPGHVTLVGQLQHVDGELLIAQRDRTRSDALGSGRQHHVLGDPPDVEVVAVGELHEGDGQRSVGERIVGKAGSRQADDIMWLAQDDERPGLTIHCATGPPAGFQDRNDVIVGDRRRLKSTHRAQSHDMAVTVWLFTKWHGFSLVIQRTFNSASQISMTYSDERCQHAAGIMVIAFRCGFTPFGGGATGMVGSLSIQIRHTAHGRIL